MKISVFAIPEITLGKSNVKDVRLDQVHKITGSKKETYIQVELTGEVGLLDADAIIALKDSGSDLILKDLEFVDTRLSRAEQQQEKDLLTKLKTMLEQERFLYDAGLSAEEKQAVTKYGLLTIKPVILVSNEELENLNDLLSRALKESGFISFFTTGEKETRAWLIKEGVSAWEASGEIHSDIQKGFIRAEIISLEDFLNSGGETKAKQAGLMRLEQKDYVMRDGDLTNFRFNK